MELLINQIRQQYKLLDHRNDLTRVRCQNVDRGQQVSEARVRGINELIDWCKQYHLKGNLFLGRNPVSEEGKVCRVTAWSLDIDPVRPRGSASSPKEHVSALRVGEHIRQTYGDGYLCSSGNGSLLLFPIQSELVSDLQLFQAQCREFEKQIRERFQTSEVKIDATFDIARLVKILGSTSTKGEQKLWRHAKFIRYPIFRAKRSGILNVIKGIAVPQSVLVPGLDSQTNSQVGTGISSIIMDSDRETNRLTPSARLQLAESCLRRLAPSRADDYDSWLRVGIILKEFGPVGFNLWKQWSDTRHTKDRERFNTSDMESKWNGFRAEQNITVGTLKHWADEDSPRDVLLRTVSGTSGSERTELWTPGRPIREDTSNSVQGMQGISTGFKWLDSKLNGGYRPGVVYGVEACTNVGKSAFIVQAARYICERGKPVLLVTTEAGIEEVCQRYWAAGTGIPASKISNGSLNASDKEHLGRYQEAFRTHKLGIWYTTSPKTAEIEGQINAFKPAIVLWDYFQHFETGTESRQVQLGSLARWFESTAIRCHIPFVVAAQLHERYDFKNRKKMPSIKDDIKDCKVLNDVCKTVMVIDWAQADQTTEDGPVLVRLALEKNKGPMGETKIILHRNIPRFDEI